MDVELYADSNGDGVGDFPGLTGKVDYLAGLGVTCLWLMPFYPTPNTPDLNIANPRVREEISKVVGYWLELGLSGFRVDAAPFVIELEGTDHKRGEDPHAYLRDLRAFTNRRRGDAILPQSRASGHGERGRPAGSGPAGAVRAA